MNNFIKYALLVCFFSFHAWASPEYRQIPYEDKLNQILNACDVSVAVNFEPYARCPEVMKFKLKKYTEDSVAAFLKAMHLNPVKTNAREGFASLDEWIVMQKESLINTGERKVVRAFEKARKAVRSFVITAQKSGLEMGLDTNAFWAPQLSARVIVIYNPKQSTITLVRHGVDGG